MDLQQKFELNSNVMARAVGDETVILHLGSGTYFGLDPVGKRIWDLIETGGRLTDICDALVAEFGEPRERIEGDVKVLVQELIEHKLLEPASD